MAAVGYATLNPGLFKVSLLLLASVATETLGKALAKKPGVTAFDPQAINPDTAAPRKLVFGRTLFPVDLRYTEPSGTNQEYIDYIFALAAHKSDAITDIYIEDDLAWTVGGGVQGKYVGYLTIEIILEAGSAAYHTVNGGAIWGSSTRLTGCTTMKVRIKRSGNSQTERSPFESGISGRWAVIGRGIPVYDPARDSTVAGGSGSQRANDQTTWAYTVSSVARGNNPALQMLTYLLGWKIGGVVSVGCGLPADVIDLPSFATAAALCDESVALAAGGNQRRFEAGRAFSDADDPAGVIKVLLDAMNAELVDDGGRLALRIAVNDLTAAFTLTDDDFVSGYSWRPAPPIDRQFTVVRGRYSQPDAPTLFNLVDYPEVAIPRTSLAPRALTLELSAVQEPRRAERIAKQTAQRSLYQGEFSVTLGIRGWLLKRNMVVAITSNVRGWTAKLFRVRSLSFTPDGTVEAVFREENAAVYAWDAAESALVTPVAPVVFDSRAAASWLMAGIDAGATVNEDGGGNLVAAPRDGSTWQMISGATVTSVVASTLGGDAVQMGAAGRGAIWHQGTFGVTPGELLFARHVVTCDASAPADSLVLAGFNFFDRTGTLLSAPNDAINAEGSDATAAAAFNIAYRAEGKARVPAGAAFARLYSIRAGGAGGTFYANQPRAGRDQVGADVTGGALPELASGAWESGRVYQIGSVVQFGAAAYTARVQHTSSGSNAPPAAEYWRNLVTVSDSAAAALVNFTTGSTSYGAAAVQFSARAGTTGNVDLSVQMGVVCDDNNTTSYGAAGKWQRETSPGTWADVGSEQTTATSAFPGGPNSLLDVVATAGSLSNGTLYSFRLLLRRTGSGPGTDTVILSGQALGNGR